MPFYVFFMHNIFNNCHYYSTQVSVLLIIWTRSWWSLVVGILITLIVIFVYNTLRQSHRPGADWNVMDSVSTHKIGSSQSIRWGTWLSLRKTETSVFHMRIFFCEYTPFCPQANTRELADRDFMKVWHSLSSAARFACGNTQVDYPILEFLLYSFQEFTTSAWAHLCSTEVYSRRVQVAITLLQSP